jgi:two-component system response regulator AtoC/two-component system nitrogen regulation response regulator NtrX
MRMVGLELSLPPLRERLDDIPALLALFLSKKGIMLDAYRFETVTSKLQSFSWPGNIRQFFKCLEAWLLYCELDGVQISADNFPMFKDLQVPAGKKALRPHEGHLDFNVALSEDRDYEQSMASYEKTFLANAMERHASIAEVCKAINIPRSTLDAKRRRHGLV